jgi:hypothetical protein
MTETLGKVGKAAFVIGLIIAVIAGIFGASTGWVPLALVVLGLIVGFLNITEEEVNDFLIAAIALILVGTIGGGLSTIPTIGDYLAAIVADIAVFVVPAALVVSLKAVWSLAKD